MKWTGSSIAAFSAVLFLVAHQSPTHAVVWPAEEQVSPGQWKPIYRNRIFLQDPITDTNGSRNVVSDPTHPAAYTCNNLVNIFFRLRLDSSPAGSGGQGFLLPFGWGVEFDTNLSLNDYEWLIMVDGVSKTESVTVQRNSIQGTVGAPGDQTESTSYTYTPITTYVRILQADTQFNGDQDYFLDWYVPFADLKAASGLADSSPIRTFWGSSSSANSLSENGADLVGGSDLYAMSSDYMTPLGATATTGTVAFVAGIDGSGDVPAFTAGDTVFVKVVDADQNYDNLTRQSIQVTFTSSAGDRETVTLTETDISTGIFTGLIRTTVAAATTDGVLQVSGGTVGATYTDAVDASGAINQPRTDTVSVISPQIAIVKSVRGKSSPSDTLLYTSVYRNTGSSNAYRILVGDAVPAYTDYVRGSSVGADTTTFSHDNGLNYNSSDAPPVTHIRWIVSGPLAPAGVDSVRFKVTIE